MEISLWFGTVRRYLCDMSVGIRLRWLLLLLGVALGGCASPKSHLVDPGRDDSLPQEQISYAPVTNETSRARFKIVARDAAVILEPAEAPAEVQALLPPVRLTSEGADTQLRPRVLTPSELDLLSKYMSGESQERIEMHPVSGQRVSAKVVRTFTYPSPSSGSKSDQTGTTMSFLPRAVGSGIGVDFDVRMREFDGFAGSTAGTYTNPTFRSRRTSERRVVPDGGALLIPMLDGTQQVEERFPIPLLGRLIAKEYEQRYLLALLVEFQKE